LIRHRIAVIVILAAAGFTLFDFLLSLPGLSFPDIGAADKHFAEVAPTLPPSGVVGYWTDIQGGIAEQQEYYLLQYALVPRVIVKSLAQQFVVSSVHSAQSKIPGADLELVRDFESGLKVFRKKTK
jgi:hypothetical protein